MALDPVQPASQQIAVVDTTTGKPSVFGLQFFNALANGLNAVISAIIGTTNNNITTAKIGGLTLITGSGSPQGVVTASPGTLYLNQSGGAGVTFWVKETGSDDNGWTAR